MAPLTIGKGLNSEFEVVFPRTKYVEKIKKRGKVQESIRGETN